jgi:hypothetical protein
MARGSSQDQTLDYQHFIDYQLTRAQGRMKSVEIGTAVVRLLAATLLYLVAVIGLDHALILSSGVRLALLLVALAAALGYFGVAVVLPAWRRINHLYTARTIERATPEFKNSLINFLELRRRPEQVSAGVLALLEERAVSDLSGVQVEEKINQDRLVRACYGLAAAVLVTCLAVLINARSLVDSLGRVLLPTADIQPPTQTRLTEIKPGDKTVVALSSVTVSAIADGKQPEQVSLHWSDDGKFWREQPLQKQQGDSQFDPWTTQLVVEKPLLYYLVAADCRTKQYTIEVTQPPMVTDLELIYDYPDYTGWAQYTSQNGNIDALEGTVITLTATANRPVSSGQIRFGNKSLVRDMHSVANRNDQLTAQFAVTKDDSYVIWFVTADNETNPRPTSYEIKVRTDLPPTVVVKPGTDQVDPPVPANAIVPIGVTARDDFGIDEVKLNIAQGQETVESFDLTDLQNAGKEFETTYRFDLEKLRLSNGDEFEYWVDVADNRQPRRNRVSSPHYRIRLGSPLSPSEREDEQNRQVQLARAEDAEKAAQAAQKAANEQGQQTDDPAAGGNADQPGPSEEPAPKDERALDVIRKYMQEKDQQQIEQPRDGQSEQDNTDPMPSADAEEQQSQDAGNDANQKGQNAGKDAADGENADADSNTQDKSGSKPGNQPQNDNNSGPGDKQNSQKPAGDKQGDDKTKRDSTGEKMSDQGTPSKDKSNEGGAGDSKDESGDDRQDSRKPGEKSSSGEKQGGEKSKADQSGSQLGEPKSGGQEVKKDKSGGSAKGDERSKQDRTADAQSPDDPQGVSQRSGDKAGGEKSSGDKGSNRLQRQSADDKAQGDEGAGDEAANPASDKRDGSQSAAQKTGQKQKQGDSSGAAGKPKGQDSGSEPDNDSAGDPGDDMKSGDKGSKKPGGGKSQDDLAGDSPPQSSKSQNDRARAGQSGGQKSNAKQPDGAKSAGDPQGGQDDSKAKPDGDKSGGERSDGEESGSDEKGAGTQSGDGKDQGDKAGGDEADGEKSDQDAAAGEKSPAGGQSGDKQGGDKQSSASGGSKGAPQGAPGKSDAATASKGDGAPAGQGAGSTGGGSNSSGERTEKAQPGGGENKGQGPMRKNDATARETPATGSAPVPDYSNEGSELVLERLAKQLDKGEVDPELLERLGWTRDELEQFVKEFHGPGPTDETRPDDVGKADTKKPAERGKTTLNETRIRSTRRGPGQKAVDALGENYEGRRTKPAPEYDDHVRAYNMSQSKSDKSAPASPKTK